MLLCGTFQSLIVAYPRGISEELQGHSPKSVVSYPKGPASLFVQELGFCAIHLGYRAGEEEIAIEGNLTVSVYSSSSSAVSSTADA